MEQHNPQHGTEPNFKFPQEDYLYEYSRRTGAIWVFTWPGFILSAAETTAMDIIYPLSVYSAVQAHLYKSLEFPADVAAWDVEKRQSTGSPIAYHVE